MYSIYKVVSVFFLTSLVLFSIDAFSVEKGTVLITGANRGLGLALTKKFHDEGYAVIATARQPDKASDLRNLGVRIEALDVSNSESVSLLKKALAADKIDILINNAGISGHSASAFSDLDVDKLSTVFDVNSLGMLRVTQALISNMNDSPTKIIANMSSLMGSIEDNTRGCCYGYRSSKAALNSFTKSLAIEYDKQGFVFVVLHPGWVRTDMGTNMATYSTKESADALFNVITGLKPTDNGLFYDLHGKLLKW